MATLTNAVAAVIEAAQRSMDLLQCSLGRGEEARAVADRLREVEPDLTVSTAIRSARFANPDKNAELGDALLLAGLPE